MITVSYQLCSCSYYLVYVLCTHVTCVQSDSLQHTQLSGKGLNRLKADHDRGSSMKLKVVKHVAFDIDG